MWRGNERWAEFRVENRKETFHPFLEKKEKCKTKKETEAVFCGKRTEMKYFK
jgi:hypothetical protein